MPRGCLCRAWSDSHCSCAGHRRWCRPRCASANDSRTRVLSGARPGRQWGRRIRRGRGARRGIRGRGVHAWSLHPGSIRTGSVLCGGGEAHRVCTCRVRTLARARRGRGCFEFCHSDPARAAGGNDADGRWSRIPRIRRKDRCAAGSSICSQRRACARRPTGAARQGCRDRGIVRRRCFVRAAQRHRRFRDRLGGIVEREGGPRAAGQRPGRNGRKRRRQRRWRGLQCGRSSRRNGERCCRQWRQRRRERIRRQRRAELQRPLGNRGLRKGTHTGFQD